MWLRQLVTQSLVNTALEAGEVLTMKQLLAAYEEVTGKSFKKKNN